MTQVGYIHLVLCGNAGGRHNAFRFFPVRACEQVLVPLRDADNSRKRKIRKKQEVQKNDENDENDE